MLPSVAGIGDIQIKPAAIAAGPQILPLWGGAR
jgi:hypothetical protein